MTKAMVNSDVVNKEMVKERWGKRSNSRRKN